MKKITKLLAMVAVAVFAGSMFSSCLKSNEPTPQDTILSTYVTYEGSNTLTMAFSTYQYEGSPKVTYTTGIIDAFKKELNPGDRMVLWFTNESSKVYESGNIVIQQAFKPFTDTVEYASKETIMTLTKSRAVPVYRNLEGGYMDITMEAALNQKPMVFNVYVDSATIDNDYPDAYMCYVPDHEMGLTRNFFGSFDMTRLLGRPNCKGVKLHFGWNNDSRFVQQFNVNGTAPGEPAVDNN